MYYEINVALNGVHFFATNKRSLTSQSHMARALRIFVKKFPKNEGYSISVTRHESRGYGIDVESIIGEE